MRLSQTHGHFVKPSGLRSRFSFLSKKEGQIIQDSEKVFGLSGCGETHSRRSTVHISRRLGLATRQYCEFYRLGRLPASQTCACATHSSQSPESRTQLAVSTNHLLVYYVSAKFYQFNLCKKVIDFCNLPPKGLFLGLVYLDSFLLLP